MPPRERGKPSMLCVGVLTVPTLRDAIQTTQDKTKKRAEPLRNITRGELIDIGGSVEVTGRPGYCWVREYGEDGGVSQAFNPTTQPSNGLAVLIGHAPKAPYRRIVLDVNWEMIAGSPDYDGDPYLPAHHKTHEWPDGLPGPDPVTVYGRSLSMLRTYPGSAGLTASISPYRYERDGTVITFAGHADYDVSGSQPGVGLARYTLIYLDTDTNLIGVVDGDTAVDAGPVVPPFPAPPLAAIPSAWIRLDGAATAVFEADIVDARMLLSEITGQMLPILAGIAHAEEELDYEFSDHIVQHNPILTSRLALLEAEYDFDQSKHVVEG